MSQLSDDASPYEVARAALQVRELCLKIKRGASHSSAAARPSAARPARPQQRLFTSTGLLPVRFAPGYDGSLDQLLNWDDAHVFAWELIQRFLQLYVRPVSISYQVSLAAAML